MVMPKAKKKAFICRRSECKREVVRMRRHNGQQPYKSTDNVGSVMHQHPSPQSSPEVNVTNNFQIDLDKHVTSGSQAIYLRDQSNMVETAREVDIQEPDEAEVTGTSNQVVGSQNVVDTSGALRKRLTIKNLALLPPDDNNLLQDGKGPQATLKPSAAPNHRIHITANHGSNESNKMFCSRGDGNTSNSPYPFGSLPAKSSSREVSSNRLSITNSPLDNEITEIGPMIDSRRPCASDPSTSMSNMDAQFFLNISSTKGLIPRNKWIARLLTAQQEIESASARKSNSSMHCATPLLPEIPNRDFRRAGDLERAMDQNSSPLKQLQQCHSLNMVKPQDPKNMSKSCSNNMSSSSLRSIHSDQGLEDYVSQFMNTDTEAALVDQMLVDNEDMIIPDDMRRFMNELNGDGHSMYSYDPSGPTNDGCFMAMNSHGQGKMGSNLALTDGQMNLQDISRETRAARVEGQHIQSRNLPQQISCQQALNAPKGVIPASQAGSSNGNNARHQLNAKDAFINPGSYDTFDWSATNNDSIQTNNMVNVPVNIGMQNVNAPQMMQSPVSSDNQVHCPPRSPTSGQNMPITSLYLKNLNQMQMNQNQGQVQIMCNRTFQGEVLILYPTRRNQILAQQQQQLQSQMMSYLNPNLLMDMQQQEMFGCYSPMNTQQYQQLHQQRMMHNSQNVLMNMQQQEMFGCYSPMNTQQYQQLHQQRMMHNNQNVLMNMQQQEMFGYYSPMNPQQYQQQHQQQMLHNTPNALMNIQQQEMKHQQ